MDVVQPKFYGTDPLLGNDFEMKSETTAATPKGNRIMVFSTRVEQYHVKQL